MQILGVVLAIMVMGAKMAFAAGSASCVLDFEDGGTAGLRASPAEADSVAGLCNALVRAMGARPELSRALAQENAHIQLHVHTDRPHQLSAQLILHMGGQDHPGATLTLGQLDGGSLDFDATTLNRLARHLLDAPPFVPLSTRG